LFRGRLRAWLHGLHLHGGCHGHGSDCGCAAPASGCDAAPSCGC
jgi:hypothetical protein